MRFLGLGRTNSGGKPRIARDLANLAFESARPMIKVRVYAEHFADREVDPDSGPVSEVIAPGLRRMLALDLPTLVRSVSRVDAARWGVAVEELWDLGLANVKAQDIPETAPLGDGGTLLSGESFFVATSALILEHYLDPVPEHGAVLVVPDRHTLAFKPIHDVSILPSCRTLLVFADRMFKQGVGSISTGLYWWRGGKLELLPGRLGPAGVEFMPTDEFVEVLNSLPEPNPR